MKICSFDVGIVHLAYCIIKYKPHKKHPFKIKEWRKIDLTDYKEQYCCGLNQKTKEPCDKKALFMAKKGDTYKSYCGTHSKQCTKKYIPCSKKEKKCCEFFKKRKNVECGDKATYKINFVKEIPRKKGSRAKTKYKVTTNYFCTKHLEKKKYPTLEKKKTRKANKIPIQNIQKKLVEVLNGLPQLLKVDRMVIENQPTLKNPRMKAVSSTLFDFFLMRTTIDRTSKCKIDKLLYMSPSNKLKVDEKNTLQVLGRTGKDKKYKMTKELGMKYCKRLIKHDKKNMDFLESHKKQDDLCDAYLQGCYYLQHRYATEKEL